MQWIIIGKDDVEVVPGGLNRYVRGLVGGIRGRGDLCTLLLSGTGMNTENCRFMPGGTLQRVVKFFIEGLRSPKSVNAINIHFALYGAPFLFGFLVAGFTSKLKMHPSRFIRPVVLYHFHGPWAEESRVAGIGGRVSILAKRFLEKYCISSADRVIVLSEEFRRDAISRFGCTSEQVVVVPPGIDQEWFEQEIITNPGSSGSLRLICVRRLTPRMGHLHLLNRLEQLHWEVDGLKVTLDIVGRGPQEDAIRRWCSAHNRSDTVRLHGYVADADLRKLMQRSNVAVVPTLQLEGFGLVVLEAMAQKLPVISTGQGGLTEAMGPWGKAPFIFDLSDGASLCRALSAASLLGASEEQRLSLATYAAGFKWQDVARRVTEVASRGAGS